MWEKLVNCIKTNGGGGKKTSCQAVQLADLVKQVPPNQMKMYEMFAKKHEEYKDRVRKHPESLPTIDWEYYRTNVREEFVDWVKGYENKYDKLHSLFENRHAMVDHKRYFDQVDVEEAEVTKAISQYKAESNERIKELNKKLEFVKAMVPYDQMTMEEFCYARPHLAPDFINKPTFWPHTPEEQTPGPSDPEAAAALHHEEEPEPPEPKTPEKPPEKTAGDAKPAAAAAPKKPTEPAVDTSQLAEKASEMAKELVAKAIVLFNALKEKISGMAKNVQKKADEARAEKSETPTSPSQETRDRIAERQPGSNVCNQTIIRGEEAESNPDVKARHTNLSIESDPCDPQEERSREIARTLERKRQLQEAEEWDKYRNKGDPCKPEEESICEPDPCKQKDELICEPDPCQADPCKAKDEEAICKPDPCEQKEEDICKLDPCEQKEKDICKPDPCEQKEEDICKPDPCEQKEEDICKPDPCKPKDEEGVCDEDEDPCKKKPEEKEDGKFDKENEGDSENYKNQEQVFINIAKCSEDLAKKDKEKSADPGKPKEKASLPGTVQGSDQKPILGLQLTESKGARKDQKDRIEGADEVGHVYTDPNQLAELLAKEKEKKEKELMEKSVPAIIEEVIKPEDGNPVTIYPRLEIPARSKTEEPNNDKTVKSAKDMANQVFSMASGAASLLTDATNTLEDLKKKKEARLEALEQAYISAQRQAEGAQAEATKAVEAANKLALRSAQETGEVSNRDREAVEMAEKHAILAKMLASRAVALKEEIARVLNDLKKKQ
ncbi:glutamic acid-rich protein [Drosophila eugracilis]|uniref:glutamic acid-rich protein n=1 Tax=Drosophila eugracilis TaxID=29029 RepID=UPI0007E7CBBD|nr:glutamic acid-rich protein [Drosophila eugracilis]